ncbi:hypothetical protein ABZT45_36455 [Streptomyces sp. NPDC005356]|uniref:hypothetical protein n=1 Tax=Streptomyces sp. NPDC005356 TaxID=3157167 RepID=UPI0033A7BA00
MPGARLPLAASLATLITSLAAALDNDADTLDLDGVEVLTGLVSAYVALLNAQAARTAGR